MGWVSSENSRRAVFLPLSYGPSQARGVRSFRRPGFLERLSESVPQSAPADQRAAEPEKRLVDVGPPLEPNPEPAEAVKPREGPLHDPAEGPEAAAVSDVAMSQDRADAALAQLVAVRFRVVGPIPEETVGTATGVAGTTAYRRDRVNQRQELCDVVPVGPGQRYRQRDAVGVGDDVMLAPRSGPVRGIRAGFFPPPRPREPSRSRSPHATSRAGRRLGASRAGASGASPRPQRTATPLGGASTSSPSRNSSPAAAAPKGSRSSARRGSP